MSEQKVVREYKEQTSFASRRFKSIEIMKKHPGRFPLITLPAANSAVILPSEKYLIPGETTMGHFLYALRRTLSLPRTTGMYLYIYTIMPMLNSKVSELYERFSDEDGFLYLLYTDQEDKGDCVI